MDLLRADRDVAAAAADLRLLGPDVDWERHRHVSGQRALRALEAASEGPLRDALATHIAWLTVARVAQPAEKRLAAARASAHGIVRLERDVRLDFRAIVDGLLAAKTPGEARAHFAALPEAAAAVGEPARTVREVRAEALRRLGIEDVGKRFLGVPSGELVARARQLLEKTADLAAETVRSFGSERSGVHWPLDMDVRLARSALEGWPSRLTWRTAASLLPGLALRGTLVGEPPRALGAVSFARALATLGESFRRSIASSSAPYVLRESPLSPEGFRAGLVLASALGERAFHARVLGLGSGRATDQARALGVAFLLDARFSAMRVALRDRSDLEAVTALALGEPLPKVLAEAWPDPSDEHLARFFALLAAPAIVDALRDREGDDWFRNPRAFATLRDLLQTPTTLADDAAARLARRFEESIA